LFYRVSEPQNRGHFCWKRFCRAATKIGSGILAHRHAIGYSFRAPETRNAKGSR